VFGAAAILLGVFGLIVVPGAVGAMVMGVVAASVTAGSFHRRLRRARFGPRRNRPAIPGVGGVVDPTRTEGVSRPVGSDRGRGRRADGTGAWMILGV
jgi:hypothetical protein